MMLIAIGENLKNLDKITGGTILPQYPEMDWKGAKGMRDIISHHYFDLECRGNVLHLQRSYTRLD
jgi:uncharacterized protein with HEPN domain